MTTALDKVLAASTGSTDVKLADGDTEPYDAHVLVEAADASLDEACKILSACDLSHLSPELRQAVALVYASSVCVDGLIDALNLPDPDDGLGFTASSGYRRGNSRWVEETAFDPRSVGLADSDSGKSPYGNVTYADPGYQSDGKKRYPVDTEDHARAAWAYINKGHNAEQYSSGDLTKVKNAIRRAMRKFGIEESGGDNQKVAASVAMLEPSALALAAQKPMVEHSFKNHGPFHGAHGHMHMHINDNRHGPGVMGLAASGPGGGGQLPAYHHAPMTGMHDHDHIHANDATHGPIRYMGNPMSRDDATF
jgi:hypothetical protein